MNKKQSKNLPKVLKWARGILIAQIILSVLVVSLVIGLSTWLEPGANMTPFQQGFYEGFSESGFLMTNVAEMIGFAIAMVAMIVIHSVLPLILIARGGKGFYWVVFSLMILFMVFELASGGFPILVIIAFILLLQKSSRQYLIGDVGPTDEIQN